MAQKKEPAIGIGLSCVSRHSSCLRNRSCSIATRQPNLSISAITLFFITTQGHCFARLPAEFLIPEIHKLHGHGKILGAHRRDDGLKFVPAFAVDAHFVALNLRRHLELAVADEAGDLLGDGRFNALLDFDDLSRVAERETSGSAVSTLLRLMLRLASRPMTIPVSALI